MKNKKGQEGMSNIVMLVIGAAMVLGVGLIVLSQLNDSIADTLTATTITNETFTFANNTRTALTYTGTECIEITCTEVLNGSKTVIGTGNYSCQPSGIIIIDDGYGAAASLNVSYTCLEPNAAYNATRVNITKLATTPTWLGIVIVVALAMLILGYFYSRQ